jgi:predicted acylesterase/phospholipase RssA
MRIRRTAGVVDPVPRAESAASSRTAGATRHVRTPPVARRPRLGLALAGGGPLGGIYEVGALAALSEALDGIDFNEIDTYVGVSSGGFIAAALANGMSPEKLARMLVEDDTEEVFDPDVLLRPAIGEYFRRAISVPPLLLDALKHYFGDPWHSGLLESFQRLSHAIPTGIFDNAGIDRLLHRMFSMNGRSNDFRKLKHRLYLVATDLDSGEAIEFGAAGYDDVPISTAVQASAALPGLFPPVEIKGRFYVDGALIKTLHASVALREGAELVICINPLVPFDSGLAERRDGHPRHSVRYLVEGGLPVVLSQTFRAIIHSRMQVGMESYRHLHPGIDVVLFEPTRDDADMFFANVFSYGSRKRLCEHAYQRTRQDLYRRRHELLPLFARHGIQLNLGVLRDHRRSLLTHEEGEPLGATQRALESALNDLDSWLKTRNAA